jgi:hypothetical protein
LKCFQQLLLLLLGCTAILTLLGVSLGVTSCQLLLLLQLSACAVCNARLGQWVASLAVNSRAHYLLLLLLMMLRMLPPVATLPE